MFQFGEGAQVALKEDNSTLGLLAGSTGAVWVRYDTQPPAYEVTFTSPSGKTFDALMYEEELTEPQEKAETPRATSERAAVPI